MNPPFALRKVRSVRDRTAPCSTCSGWLLRNGLREQHETGRGVDSFCVVVSGNGTAAEPEKATDRSTIKSPSSHDAARVPHLVARLSLRQTRRTATDLFAATTMSP
eukprot:2575192-Rhodomonas_salina.1